ncbi:hypothetical protein SCALM49S_02568 [Streptomyces californicus]
MAGGAEGAGLEDGRVPGAGWPDNTGAAWQRILSTVRSYKDLEPQLLGRVEELIDFVTVPDDVRGLMPVVPRRSRADPWECLRPTRTID